MHDLPEDLPDDPRDEGWRRATGPDGEVWVDASNGDWVVWDQDRGYRVVGNDEFERDYEWDFGPTTLDQPEDLDADE